MRTLLIILSLLVSTALMANDNDYYVESWQYKAVVHEDNTWDVHESITVNFVQPHHGIFLYKPQLFADKHLYKGEEKTFLYALSISNLEVPGYNYVTQVNDDSQENFIIQIGDADYVLQGEHTYNVSYTIVYPDDRTSDGDNIFHSVIGDGWPSSIRRFSYEVKFDKELPTEAVNSCRILSGGWSAEDDNLNIASLGWVNSHGFGATLENLSGNQAISYRFNLPEGYFFNTHYDYIGMPGSFFGSAVKCVPVLPWLFLLASVVIGILCLLRLLKVNIERPVKSIEFYPPEGISSAEVGTIIDDSPDLADLISLIPWFAKRGYIRIDEEQKSSLFSKKTEVVLTRLKPLPNDAPEYQKTFLDALFPKGDKQNLSDLGDRHSEIASAQLKLKKEFRGSRTLTEGSNLIFVVALTLILLLVAVASDSLVYSFDVEKLMVSLCFGFVQLLLFVMFGHHAANRAFKVKSPLFLRLCCAVVCFVHASILASIYEPQNDCLPIQLTVSAVILCYCLLALSDRLVTDTPYRLQLVGKLLGLKEFIKTAEKDRLQMLVDESPEYFYDILPYAMVFGLAGKWADKFKEISLETPRWYGCSDPTMLAHSSTRMVHNITNTINHSVTQAVTSSSHAPSSGGSFGAGGGGGGGGGGAW